MQERNLQVNLFEYRDYRSFLQAWYKSAKKHIPHFSYRQFSRKAGFKTSNFLMLVMKGQRNLSDLSISKFVKGLGLNKQEADFFWNLVHFNQAKKSEEKNHFYKLLLGNKKLKQMQPIEQPHYEYYSHWYHPVIRELLCARECDGSPEWLAQHISPKVTVAQCAKSIELLEALNFVEKKENGRYRQKNSIISTGPQLTSVTVHNYHKSLLNLSLEVMDTLSNKERDVSSMTLGVKKEKVIEIRKRIAEFRKSLLEYVAEDIDPEEVLQLNIQFFPVGKSVEVGK